MKFCALPRSSLSADDTGLTGFPTRGDSMSSEPPLPRHSVWIPETFRALLEAAPDAMLIVDQEGRIALANNQATRLFGYGDGELDGENVEKLVPLRYRYKYPGTRCGIFQRATDARHGRWVGT